jgi:hypothetical protein
VTEVRDEASDVFIAHASEDKESVARPLAEALTARGYSVWLDELKLTIGDSLSRQIDSALARTRFGIVILSPAFFSKEWPQRELAGLAARELDTGSKVILPVWHDIDHEFIVKRSPVLADRLGAPTSAGIENVAKEISIAVEAPSALSSTPEAGIEAVDQGGKDELLTIPTTEAEQERLVQEQAPWWEYRLYAGTLLQARLALEDKWQDHQLRLPSGPRREVDLESVTDFLSRELGWMRRQVEALDRVFGPEVLESAFGAPGAPGNPTLIKRVTHGVIQIYDSMLDWAAALRNTSVPSDYERVVELNARMVDGPVTQIRDFTQYVADEIARIPILSKEAEAGGATVDSPMTVTLTLTLALDDGLQRELKAEFARLHRLLDN